MGRRGSEWMLLLLVGTGKGHCHGKEATDKPTTQKGEETNGKKLVVCLAN